MLNRINKYVDGLTPDVYLYHLARVAFWLAAASFFLRLALGIEAAEVLVYVFAGCTFFLAGYGYAMERKQKQDV